MKKQLPDVTLIAYTSSDLESTILSLSYCARDFDFGAIKIISHEEPAHTYKGITYEKGDKINGINDFNRYMFLELGKHVETSHCLYIQHHAFIINPELWNDNWLQYDYIGAPWEVIPNIYIANNGETVRVGNGGFSLRSKKLLDLPKKMGWDLRQEQGWYNEDGNICCYYRKEMLENGIKYAPIEIASVFSFENFVPENIGLDYFGFHRNFPPSQRAHE
jgi:hypothetical protein